ncbi:MAG TPA: arsenate reductase family protein [Candidatus Gallacutalibacter stercoravium]|nr:arsenate reductase family protein [Candidatus Gallacutalibacter stercoravium]
MANWLFVEYPKCTTCQKARRWLEEHGVAFESRHIVEHTPTATELDAWQAMSGLPLSRFFNTSGRSYRALGGKEALASKSREEQLALLADDGMLIKRPLLIGEDAVLVGFRPEQWAQTLGIQAE